MIQYICDICGKQQDSTIGWSEYRFVKFPIFEGKTQPQVYTEIYCQDCTNKVEEFIRNYRRDYERTDKPAKNSRAS